MDRTDENFAAALAHTSTEIGRADTKAGLLLTLNGLLVASLSLLGRRIDGLTLGLAAAGALALITSVILALLVIRPRKGAKGAADDKGSFWYFATADADELVSGMAEDRRPARLRVLSRIALRKMMFGRLAGDASLAAVVLIAAAILTR